MDISLLMEDTVLMRRPYLPCCIQPTVGTDKVLESIRLCGSPQPGGHVVQSSPQILHMFKELLAQLLGSFFKTPGRSACRLTFVADHAWALWLHDVSSRPEHHRVEVDGRIRVVVVVIEVV